MKITALLAAAALACGTAYANTSATTSHDTTKHSAAATDKQSGTTHEGVGVKTKRALGKMGDKIRSAGHKLAHATHTDKNASSDTRAMGASGSDTQDSGRQRRMDDAYANWQSKQHK